jgi:hypothetical protein
MPSSQLKHVCHGDWRHWQRYVNTQCSIISTVFEVASDSCTALSQKSLDWRHLNLLVILVPDIAQMSEGASCVTAVIILPVGSVMML